MPNPLADAGPLEAGHTNNSDAGPLAAGHSDTSDAGPSAAGHYNHNDAGPTAAGHLVTTEHVVASTVAAVNAIMGAGGLAASNSSSSGGRSWTPTIAAQLAGYVYQLLGFYQVLLQERSKESKKTRVKAFLNSLSQQPLTRHHMSGFHASPEMVNDVIGLRFDADPTSDQWHRGLFGLGPFFNQSPTELQRQQRQETLRETQPHLQQSLGHADQNQSRPPPVPPSLQDLITALSRHSTFHLHTLGDGPLNQLSSQLATLLLQRQMQLQQSQWMQTHGPSLIYYFNEEAYYFANDIQTEEALQQGLMASFTMPDVTALAHSLINRSPHPALPPSLLALSGTPARTPPSLLPPAPSPAPAPAPRAAGNQRQQQPPTAGGHDKETTPQGYRPFWESFGNNVPKTTVLLNKANLTTATACAELGLPPTECYNYHTKGRCGNPRCSRQHAPTLEINANRARLHLQKLQAAKSQL